MHHEFTAVYERDGDWLVAYCPEVPGANGVGHSKEEARKCLAEAFVLVLGPVLGSASPQDGEKGAEEDQHHAGPGGEHPAQHLGPDLRDPALEASDQLPLEGVEQGGHE